MKIPVVYIDGTPGVVDTEELEPLLRKRSIQSFRRLEGWVRVGFDALRGSGSGKKSPAKGAGMAINVLR